MDDGRAVPNFITAAMKGRPITVCGDGSATRCFQFVSDCVAGLDALMRNDYSRPVNIGSDAETRVDDIAEMIAGLVATNIRSTTKVPVHHLPAREDDPYRRKPDITLARKVLDWKPTVSLRDGLDMTVEWFLRGGQAPADSLHGSNGSHLIACGE
jgi:UDP-glucuronate decarboxylase